MLEELKRVIETKNNDFFSFAYSMQLLLKEWIVSTAQEKALYTCINGYAQSARNYTLSVAQDLSRNDDSHMPKSMMNRILLRNCLESYLIMTILQENPQHSEKYLATKEDDSERIESLYSNQENEKRFLKRFEWLPRFKGRRATSTKDLLKYIRFSDPEDAEFIETLIKNLDKFIHPSFHYSQKADETQAIHDMTVIYSLYVDEGLIDELKRNIYTAMKRLPIFRRFYTILQQKHSIFDYVQQHKVKTSRIPNSLVHLSRVLKDHEETTYKGRGAMFLLQDLAPRYDDLVRSTYTKNTQLFFIQSRYIIESLSTIHVLMQENEERNQVYHIHQNIKNFEAQASSRAFLNIEEDTCAENLANIDFIKKYYLDRFGVDVEESKITRLSGWALFLTSLHNSEPLNSPNFVQILGEAVLKSKDEVRHLLVFYEESNAYTHITPYAFSPETNVVHLSQIFHLVNQLLLFVVQEIFHTFDLGNKLSNNDKILFQKTLFDSLIEYNTFSIIGN